MPIFVAKFASGEKPCVLLAESYELAWSYFLGKRCGQFTVTTFVEKDLENQLVIPLSE